MESRHYANDGSYYKPSDLMRDVQAAQEQRNNPTPPATAPAETQQPEQTAAPATTAAEQTTPPAETQQPAEPATQPAGEGGTTQE